MEEVGLMEEVGMVEVGLLLVAVLQVVKMLDLTLNPFALDVAPLMNELLHTHT